MNYVAMLATCYSTKNIRTVKKSEYPHKRMPHAIKLQDGLPRPIQVQRSRLVSCEFATGVQVTFTYLSSVRLSFEVCGLAYPASFIFSTEDDRLRAEGEVDAFSYLP